MNPIIQRFREEYINKVICGECISVMKGIPDKSIDMILADLPYGTTACQWDTIIPFEPLWEQYERIIKPNGAIVLFGSQPFTSALIMSNPKLFKYEWVWKKTRKNGYVHARGMPLKEHENIIVFSKGGVYSKSENKMKYNPQGVIEFSAERINYVKTTKTHQGGLKVGSKWKQKGVFYPTSILSFKSESPTTQIHPTQKPVALFEYLIKTYTNEGDLVLDNAAGSGTTGVAARNLGRNYILIEKEPEYINIINKRLSLPTN